MSFVPPTLEKPHQVIQHLIHLIGWVNYHLHDFIINGHRYEHKFRGIEHEDGPPSGTKP